MGKNARVSATRQKDFYKNWHIYCQMTPTGCNLFFVREKGSRRKKAKMKKASVKMYPYASFCGDVNCCDFMGKICTECGEHIKIKSKKDNSVSKHYDAKHPEVITEWVSA